MSYYVHAQCATCGGHVYFSARHRKIRCPICKTVIRSTDGNVQEVEIFTKCDKCEFLNICIDRDRVIDTLELRKLTESSMEKR